MKKLVLLIALLIAIPAFADVRTFTWDAVTQDTDSQPVQGLKGYKFYVSNKSGVYTSTAGLIGANATTFTYTQNTKGTYYAVVTAYNEAGESKLSNEVMFNIGVKLPKRPTRLKMK